MKINTVSIVVCKALLVYVAVATGSNALGQTDEYPGIQGLVEPTNNYPSSFSASFSPPIDLSAAVDPRAPHIAEWTRQNQPGDTMALTGEALSAFEGVEAGRDTQFVFYGTEKPVVDGFIQRLSGRLCAVTLPDDLPPNEMYLMWPRNNFGFGEPVGINKTEAWWVGSDIVWAGQTFSVFGRNLDLGDGLCQAYIDGYGWITNKAVNPYKADFVVPALANGTHTIYIHNGHGGKYGWSDGLDFTVRNAIEWTDVVLDVTNPATWPGYGGDSPGATGDGITDDFPAIDACIGVARNIDYCTVYFPAGIYALSRSAFAAEGKMRFLGDGPELTTLKGMANFSTDQYSAGIVTIDSETTVQDMSINVGMSTVPCIGNRGSANNRFITIQNVKCSSISIDDGAFRGATISFPSSEYVNFENCEFIETSFGGYYGSRTHMYWKNCAFIGANDSNSLMMRSGDYMSMENCTAGPLSAASQNDNTWCKGRWMSGGGKTGFAYFGGNSSRNMMPRSPTVEWTGNLLEVSNITETVTYPVGTFNQYMMRFPTTFQGLTSKGWPDSSWLIKSDDSSYKFEISNVDYDTGWVTVWYWPGQSPAGIATVGMSFSMREGVDGNSGEQFMWEGHPTDYRGYPSSVTDESNFVLSGLSADYSEQGVFAIVAGTGAGQHAEIKSIDAGTGAVVLKRPLRIAPDGTSLCKIGKYMRNMAFYDNDQNGYRTWKDKYSASTALSCYGDAFAICYDGNTASELGTGVVLFSLSETTGKLSPALFNYIANNTIHSVKQAVGLWAYGFHAGSVTDDETLYGNVVRDNTISNALKGILFNTKNGEYRIDMNVLERNTVTDCDTHISDDLKVFNQVWIGNTIMGKGAGTGITFIGDNEPPVLRKNAWTKFSSAYGGDLPGAILEIPMRVIHLKNSTGSITIPLWNSGTAPMSWNATTASAWLELTKSSGSVQAENSTDELSFNLVSTSNLAVGSEAVINVNSGGGTKQITVVYEGGGAVSVYGGSDYTFDLSAYGNQPLRATLKDMTTENVVWTKTGLENVQSLTIYSHEVTYEHQYSFNIEQWDGTAWITVNKPDQKPYTFMPKTPAF